MHKKRGSPLDSLKCGPIYKLPLDAKKQLEAETCECNEMSCSPRPNTPADDQAASGSSIALAKTRAGVLGAREKRRGAAPRSSSHKLPSTLALPMSGRLYSEGVDRG